MQDLAVKAARGRVSAGTRGSCEDARLRRTRATGANGYAFPYLN